MSAKAFSSLTVYPCDCKNYFLGQYCTRTLTIKCCPCGSTYKDCELSSQLEHKAKALSAANGSSGIGN